MTRFLPLVAAAVLLLFSTAQAQSGFSIAPRIGYGTFSMGNMKALQQELIQGSGLNAKVTDSYPAHSQLGLTLGYNLSDRYALGVVLESGSTGGRVSYADYSGSYQVDQILKYKAVGVLAEHVINTGKPVFYVGLESTVMFSTLTVASDFAVYAEVLSSTDKLKTTGVGIKPHVGLGYPIGRLLPRISTGYLVYTGQPFHLPEDKNMMLLVNNEEAGPDWSGFRVNLSVGLLLF